MVSAEVNSHYRNAHVVQLEYAPFGHPTGLCAGLATAAYQSEGLTLQPCSVPARTVWIIDSADSPATAAAQLYPLVSGSTTDFVHPFAMTFPGHTEPSDKRLPQILVRHLIGNPTNVPNRLLWGTHSGAL